MDSATKKLSPAIALVYLGSAICLGIWVDYASSLILDIFSLILPIIFFIGISFRFGVSVVSVAVLFFAIGGAVLVVHGIGPFSTGELNQNIKKFWAFVLAIALISELVSILNSERNITLNRLIKSEGRFRSLTNLSADWYWEMNVNFEITRIDGKLSDAANEVCFETIGEARWQQGSVVPSNDEWILHKSALEAKLPFFNLEIKRLDKSNTPVWISVSGVPVFDEEGVFSGYSGVGKDITERKNIEESLWDLAHHDRLTGLPNRRLFQIELERSLDLARIRKSRIAVFLLDLDNFKSINDSLGHQKGDEVLIQVARRLKCVCSDKYQLFRMGGDEFIVLVNLSGISEPLENLAAVILLSVAGTYHLDADTAHLTTSIGVAVFPDNRTDGVALLRVADQAMYQAKKTGKSCFVFFSEEFDLLAKRNQWIVHELNDALANGQFTVLYQPIINLSTGRVSKAEALIRWKHPTEGFISPVEFIPLAESSGLIAKIGDWVFSEAIRVAALVRSELIPDFQVSVNKSPIQIANSDPKVSAWVSQLQQMGADPESVIVEITEGVLLHYSSHIKRKLDSYTDIGMQIALDDFGTGYSSLSYLQQHDIQYLKIDRSFVMNLEVNQRSEILCEAIIAMAHKLNIRVVAEGVETAEQLRLLLGMGCDFAQGYYFSKPIDFPLLVEYLKVRHL